MNSLAIMNCQCVLHDREKFLVTSLQDNDYSNTSFVTLSENFSWYVQLISFHTGHGCFQSSYRLFPNKSVVLCLDISDILNNLLFHFPLVFKFLYLFILGLFCFQFPVCWHHLLQDSYIVCLQFLTITYE